MESAIWLPKGTRPPPDKRQSGFSEEFGHQTYVCPDARRASLPLCPKELRTNGFSKRSFRGGGVKIKQNKTKVANGALSLFSPRCPIFRPQARSWAATRAAPRPQPTRHQHPTPPARRHAIVQREGGQARAGPRTAPGTPTQWRPPNPPPASSCLKTATITPRDRAPIRYVTFSSNFAARQDTVFEGILRNSSKSYRASLEVQGGAARANCHKSSVLHQRSWHFTYVLAGANMSRPSRGIEAKAPPGCIHPASVVQGTAQWQQR